MTARRFIITLLALIAAAAAIDFGVGMAGDYLAGHAKGGNTQRNEYINKQMQEPVVIMGSSRASHHYDPRILADTLGLKAYNAGADGNGIVHAYMQLTEILRRYTPSIIIYDFYGQYDYATEPDLTKYLQPQRPYYGKGNDALDSVFISIDSTERFKMLCNSYRYNSRIINLLSDYLHPRNQNIMGYLPLESTEMTLQKPKPWPSHEIDAQKLEYMRRFAEKCKNAGTQLYIIVSPYYFPTADPQIPTELTKIFQIYGAKVLNYSEATEYSANREYWSDTNHLSSLGAEAFTRQIASEIKRCE